MIYGKPKQTRKGGILNITRDWGQVRQRSSKNTLLQSDLYRLTKPANVMVQLIKYLIKSGRMTVKNGLDCITAQRYWIQVNKLSR